MKKAFLILTFNLLGVLAYAQSAEEYFNKAANEYIYQSDNVALNTLKTGLESYPSDQGMINLRDKILEQKQQQDQQKENQQQQEQEQNQEEQNNEEQQQNEEQNQEEQEQSQEEQQSEEQQQEQQEQSEEGEDAEEKEQQQQANPQDTEEEGEEMEQPPMSRSEKLEELNLTEEKARMILEAMKNNEIQYIQQNKRKPTKRPDSNKPDW